MNEIWRERVASALLVVYIIGWPISYGAIAAIYTPAVAGRGGEYVIAFFGAMIWPAVWLARLGAHLATYL